MVPSGICLHDSKQDRGKGLGFPPGCSAWPIPGGPGRALAFWNRADHGLGTPSVCPNLSYFSQGREGDLICGPQGAKNSLGSWTSCRPSHTHV